MAKNIPDSEPAATVAPAALKWLVTVGADSLVVEANNDTDAWAFYCDAKKTWPSRKYSKATVERLE